MKTLSPIILLCLLTSCTSEATKSNNFLDQPVPTNQNTSKYDNINTPIFLQTNLAKCLPPNHAVTKTRGVPNWTIGDFDGDGIKEFATILEKENEIQLVVFNRDETGQCTEQFSSKNLTNKLLFSAPFSQIKSSTTSQFGGVGGVRDNINFRFESSEYNIELTFYYDNQAKDYYLLKSTHTTHRNEENKNGEIIVKDFLKRSKKRKAKLGSRAHSTEEWLQKEKTALSDLDYAAIMAIVQ